LWIKNKNKNLLKKFIVFFFLASNNRIGIVFFRL